MEHLHLNNHISSKQDLNKFAKDVFDTILKYNNGSFTMSIDDGDGDGDVWKYEISVSSNRVPEIAQIKEN